MNLKDNSIIIHIIFMNNTSPNSHSSNVSSKKSKSSNSSKKSNSSTKSKSSNSSSKSSDIKKTILSGRGYALVKEHFSFRELNNCKKKLNVKPYIPCDFGGKQTPFPVYLESLSKLYVPRHFGIENFGEPDQVKRSFTQSVKINLEFKGALRPKQCAPVQAFMNTCKRGSYSSQSCGGIVSIECGGGKTVLALNIISLLKKKTIIIVHKEFLMDQWIERIIQFLPQARIGIIQQKKVEIADKDIVIAMFTFSS